LWINPAIFRTPPGYSPPVLVAASMTPGVWIGFAGGAPGDNREIAVFPERDPVIAALSNPDSPAAETVANALDPGGK